MKQIADLHIHSKYSRACSPQLTLENIDKTCRIKGIDIIATGDFTYPDWFFDIKNELQELKGSKGLYKLKSAEDDKVRFLLSTELALIYKKNNKCRRIHLVVHAPNIKAVEELNKYLDKKYNIRSDGRPILGMSAEELMKLCLSIHPKYLIYPAHLWTPWFAVFGSKSGFDSMGECFGKYTENIYAYETGLSSDPEMNWRLSSLDKLTLLSNSDAHSLPNIGREANVFNLKEISYDEIYNVIKHKNTKTQKHKNNEMQEHENTCLAELRSTKTIKHKLNSFLDYTIEFYPEEGMYHYDGHRACGISFCPKETKKQKGICPVCKKPLTVGVMNRVEELADRPIGFKPKNKPGFKKLVELDKIICEALNIKSRASKAVQAEYNNLINCLGNELDILMNIDLNKIKQAARPEIAEGIKRVRAGKLIIEPGFDGQYGAVKIFSDEEKRDNKQKSLF
ncbi:endonuclease Q family protein [Patescibacteria group bacterium]|nr:DNA helicase UvrD [Candidatus Falkowbacteria bacterium]MBU3905721.1 endonuclease Q family protein [Patescibacteria group bacterium]MBU4014960.1 endonuclease Q family protein [Patescibacteria group bacterium]MBU4026495.1 endonuclease Q family protein [Patescibacteria group bacterium]MBU4072696.1 endonuclease Q family protein [Patescibacteria group bacterium]